MSSFSTTWYEVLLIGVFLFIIVCIGYVILVELMRWFKR